MIETTVLNSFSLAKLSVRLSILKLRICLGLGTLILALTTNVLAENLAAKASPQIAETVVADSVGIKGDVSSVRSGGSWSDNQKEGSYRVIIIDHGFDHLVSKLYVQWLEQNPEESVPRVRTTVVFAKFNEMPVYSLDIAKWRPQTNRLRVDLIGHNSYSGAKCYYIVEATAPGVATLSNRKKKSKESC